LGIVRRALVIDGEADNRQQYADAFIQGGWTVHVAEDGRAGLVQALLVRPSIVVTELHLKFIDGVALCQMLRRDRAISSVPILVVTSEKRVRELDRAARAGATTVMVRPTTADVVLAEMERLICVAATSMASSRLPTPDACGVLKKSYQRYETTTPAEPPAVVVCPSCQQPLLYVTTFIGGVSARHFERWDYFACVTGCGHFQYRYRTRKLRRVS